MAELIFLGRSFYLRMTLTYRISGPVGFSDSKLHTATGPGIASILVVIHESNHAHFVMSFAWTRSMRSGTRSIRSGTKNNCEHAIWRCCKGKVLHSLMLKTRHVALSAPSGCALQAAQGLAGAIFTLWVTPPTSPRPTILLLQNLSSRENYPGSDIISNSHDANWRL